MRPPTGPVTHQFTEGDRYDHHHARHGSQTSRDDLAEKDRAGRGHLLPDHLRLDPHPRPLRPGEEPPGLDPQLRHPHRRIGGLPPGGDRRAGRHRHRRHAVPGRQAAERRRRARLCHLPPPGSEHDLHRRPQPALAGDPAAGAERPEPMRPPSSPPARRTSRSTTGRCCSGRPSCRASTPCCWAP